MLIFNILYIVFFVVVFWIVGSTLLYEKKTKVVPAPVMPWVFNRALQHLKNCLEKEEPLKIVDLGCGWGGALLRLSRAFPNSHVTGYELSRWPFWISKLRTMFKRKKIAVFKQNFFDVGLAEYDVVFCYLLPYHLEKLKPIFAGLRPNTLIVSCSFEIKGWTPEKEDHIGRFIKVPVYIYRISP